MGWSTSLPVISLSDKSIWISQKTSQQFEEKDFLDRINDIQSVSVLQYYENRKRKSSEKITWFMCNQCEYSSVSKSDSFEHFIKNHMFLCTLCSFTGLTRSCVLKHCFESHERVAGGKIKNIKAYNVNADRLVSELGASNKEFDSSLFDLQKNKPFLYESDHSSDDGISNSSFLIKSHKESSDGGTGIESKSARNDSSSQNGERNKTGLVHFLDRTSSPGHRKSKHYENDFNELSDSNQLELFFSSDGDENDPDLSESIFHDHKEMFMVSRLPFPIRQDDSPNEPMLNESNQSVEAPSILQTILQKDRLDVTNGPSTSSAAYAPEKNCEGANICQSISPGLSLPSAETLQKQLEDAILISPEVSSFDTQRYDLEKKNSMHPLNSMEVPGSFQTPVIKDEVITDNEHIEDDSPLKSANHNEKKTEDNFLLSPSTDDKKDDNHENDSGPQSDVTSNTEKYTLLRNLLEDENFRNSPQNDKCKFSKISLNHEKPTIYFPDHMPLTLRNASNMSLLQLLSTDIPFPLLDSDIVNKNSDSSPIRHPTSSSVVKGDESNLDFTHQSGLENCVKRCNGEKQQTSFVQTQTSNPDYPQNNSPCITSQQLKSSLITDKWTTSKLLSKFSEYHPNATDNVKVSPTNIKSNHLMKNKKRFHIEKVSRIGLKHYRSKTLSATAMKTQPKCIKKLNHQLTDVKSLHTDNLFFRHHKRKAEQDDDYYPGSESSESSENSSDDSLKHRRRSKRSRKHLFVRKPKIKMHVSRSLTPKRNGPIAETPILNDGSSKLSSSLSSSLSSTLSSSSSSSALSHSSVIETICKERESFLFIENAKDKDVQLRVKQAPDTECKGSSTELPLAKSELTVLSEKDIKKEIIDDSNVQHQPLSIVQSSLSQQDKLKESPNLLHHLLSERPIRSVTTYTSSMTDIKEINRKTAYKRRSSSNSFTEGSINIESLSKVRSDTYESLSQNGSQSQAKHKQKDGSILNSILEGDSEYGKRAFGNRSYCATDSDYANNVSHCKNIENHSSSSSRLSASMMDIPDPPATNFLSEKEFVVQSSSLSTCLSSAPSSSPQSVVMINEPQKQEFINSKSCNSDIILQSYTTLKSPVSPSVQSSSSHTFKSKAQETSSVQNPCKNDDSSSNNLLRNLLTLTAKNVSNTM